MMQQEYQNKYYQMDDEDQDEHNLCFDKQFSYLPLILGIISVLAFYCFVAGLIIRNRNKIVFKERCGKLLLAQVIATCTFTLVFPICVISGQFVFEDFSFSLVVFFLAFTKFIAIFVYFIRSLRISRAYQENLKFYNFVNTEAKCVIILLILPLLIAIPESFIGFDQNIFQLNTNQQNTESYMWLRYTFRFLSEIILLVSFLLMRKTQVLFGIDFLFALILEIAITGSKTTLFNYGIQYCWKITDNNGNRFFPIFYVIDCCKLLILCIVSVLVPMVWKQIPMADLPFEMQAQNFTFFLNEPQFIRVFASFLQYYDEVKGRSSLANHTTCLRPVNKTFTLSETNVQYLQNNTHIAFLIYIDLTMIFENYGENKKQIDEKLITYFSNQANQSYLYQGLPNMMHDHLRQQISALSNKENRDDDYDVFEFGWQIKEIIALTLRDVFEKQYQKTVSYNAILEQCQKNKQIWRRLAKLNLSGVE
ncbi:hypothetical protein pb186bvf_008998 [Paramecium bursaria]